MSNKEKNRKGMGEVNIFNYREKNNGLYIGSDYEVGKVLPVSLKKDNETEKYMELGSLGESKKIVFGNPKCSKK